MASRTTYTAGVRVLGGVPVLTGLLASCFVTMAPPPAASVPASPPVEVGRAEPPGSVRKTSLALDVYLNVVRENRKQRIDPGDQLKRGDNFEMLIRSNQPAYVYLVQPSSRGEVSMLFPSQGDQLLSGEQEYRLPADPEFWYQVAGDDDEENLYLVMARDPIPDLNKLLPHVAEPSASPVPRAPSTDSSAAPRRTDSKSPQLPRLREDVVLSVGKRNVIQVRKAGAVTATLPADASDTDSILVRQLHFGRK